MPGLKNLDDKILLKTSPDPIKDQTYFLAYLTQQQLSRAVIPNWYLQEKANQRTCT